MNRHWTEIVTDSIGPNSTMETLEATIAKLRSKGKLDGYSEESIDIVREAFRRASCMDGDGLVSYPNPSPAAPAAKD